MKPKPSLFAHSRRIEGAYRRDIEKLFASIFRLPKSEGLDGLLSRILSMNGLSDFFERNAVHTASRMVTAQAQQNARNWREAALKGSRSREIYTAIQQELKSPVGEVWNLLIERNASLIRAIPADVARDVTAFVGREQLKGRRAADIAIDLRLKLPEASRAKIDLIARTEVSKAATALTQARATSIGINAYEWNTSEDARVRDSHKRMDKTLVFWNDPPSPEALVGDNSSLGHYHAGNAPNCFPGDTKVSQFNGLQAIWRAPYDGHLVIIGVGAMTLRVTPNHPILTRDGWKAANLINKGDEVVQAGVHRDHVTKADADNTLPTFEEVFESLSCDVEMRPALDFNFYGDIPNGDVEQIRPNSKLRGGMQALQLQSGKYLSLTFTDSGIVFAAESAIPHILRANLSRLSNVRPSPLGGLATHPQSVAFADASAGDSIASQNTPNGYPVYPVESTQDVFARSINVSSDNRRLGKDLATVRVTSIGREPFSGYVYTAQTNVGWYGVSHLSIVAKNCRCDCAPLVRLDEVSWPARVYAGGKIERMSRKRFEALNR